MRTVVEYLNKDGTKFDFADVEPGTYYVLHVLDVKIEYYPNEDVTVMKYFVASKGKRSRLDE